MALPTKELTKWIAIVQRGKISIELKARHAVAKGACALIVYNNAAELPDLFETQLDLKFDTFPILVTSSADGPGLADQLIAATGPARAHAIVRSTRDLRIFLKACLKKATRSVLFSWLAGPIAFLLSYLGCSSFVSVFAGLVAVVAACIQVWYMRDFERSLKEQFSDFPHLIKAINAMSAVKKYYDISTCCVPVWLWVLGENIVEYVDPMLDGQQVGRSFAVSRHVDAIFRRSWEHVCSADGNFPVLCPTYLGLSRTLLLIFINSLTWPVLWGLIWGYGGSVSATQQLLYDCMDSSVDEEALRKQLATGRALRWGGMSMFVDSGNLPLLGFMFRQLAEAENKLTGEQGSYDQSLFFILRVLFEALPMLWFQVSLLGLAWAESSQIATLFNIISIATSFKCVATTTFGMFQEQYQGTPHVMLLEGMKWWRAKRRGALFSPDNLDDTPPLRNAEQGLLVIFFDGPCLIGGLLSIAGMALCTIRLYGAFVCDSHILNVMQLSFTDFQQGCYVP